MLAREFLEWAGFEAADMNLYRLSQYTHGTHFEGRYHDYPDASVNGLEMEFQEPAGFQEWMKDREKAKIIIRYKTHAQNYLCPKCGEMIRAGFYYSIGDDGQEILGIPREPYDFGCGCGFHIDDCETW